MSIFQNVQEHKKGKFKTEKDGDFFIVRELIDGRWMYAMRVRATSHAGALEAALMRKLYR